PGGYVFVDGAGVGDIGPAVMRDREILAHEGFVIVVAAVNRNGVVIGEPEIISRGFVFLRDSEGLFDNLKRTVRQTLARTQNGRRNEAVEDAIAKQIFTETRRRPMVFVHLQELVAE